MASNDVDARPSNNTTHLVTAAPSGSPASTPASTPAPGAGVLVGAAVFAYMGLGLPEAALGVTFPAIRESLGLDLSALGLLLLPYTGAYIVASLSNGRVAPRLGTPRLLMAAAASAALGALVYVVGPAFVVLMVGSLFLGASAGALDATLNAYVAVHLEHRFLAFMHGGFGVGATIGPLGVTALLAAGASWRVAYALLAGLQIALAVMWFRLRARFVDSPVHGAEVHGQVVGFEGDVAETEAPRPGTSATPLGSLRAPHLLPALNVMLFFLYGGVEVSTGLLIATLLVSRGASPTSAGLLASAYWLALTIGRFATGAVGARLAPSHAMVVAVAGTASGLALVWLGGATVAAAGLVMLGFSLAPLFPSLVALTPSRVGAARTPRIIGYQLAGASVGVTVVPGIISLIADRLGAGAIAPCLFAGGLLFALVHVVAGVIAHDLW